MKESNQYLGLRKAGNAPRFGKLAIFILAILAIYLIFTYYSKAHVKEVYVEKTYRMSKGAVIETEFRSEREYRIDPDKLLAGANKDMLMAAIEADVEAKAKAMSEIKMDTPEPEIADIAEVTEIAAELVVEPVKHFPESTYVKGAIMVHGEAGGVASITERSGCLWIACNRVVNVRYPDSLESVIEQKWQFDGYDPNGTYTEADYNLAVDVFERFYREQNGESPEAVGRTLPAEYIFFTGDGAHNYFTKEQNGTPYIWGSQLISPYKN